jgi:hypothetical protein
LLIILKQAEQAIVLTYFVIMGNATEYCEVMCREIIGRKNVLFINKANNLKSDITQSLDLLFQKVSTKTNISFFPSFRFKSYFCGAFIPEENDLCFIFFDSNAHSRDKIFLKYIRDKYKAKFVLYVMNPTSAIELDRELCTNYYDLVFTVYANDADYYGWHTSNHIYSKIPDIKPSPCNGYDADVFFIGRAKNRLQKILHTYKFLVSHDIKCDFLIVDADEKEKRYASDIHYSKWLPYKEVLKRMCRSRCVLEILQKPGEGPTLRTTEAIIYNKKIITNDVDAATNTFYNNRFVHIFDIPENINLNFIKDDSEPHYNYDGEYSANNFLKRIEEILLKR